MKLFLSQQKIQQTFETLLGLIDGICADNTIKSSEINALKSWVEMHEYLKYRSPFNEIIKIVKPAITDGILTNEEIKDIRYVCVNVLKNYNAFDIGRLHGLASGIASDGDLNELEWNTLKIWLRESSYLKGSWPYDEINTLVTKHQRAEALSIQEKEIVIYYFNDFCGLNKNLSLTHPLNEPNMPITGICAICPEVEVFEKVFCLTGESRKYPRKEIADKIIEYGGSYKNDVSGLVDYLVVCSEGSPMWIYSCYGRKVEAAIAMRKEGHRIQIIHEFDLWDYFEDVA